MLPILGRLCGVPTWPGLGVGWIPYGGCCWLGFICPPPLARASVCDSWVPVWYCGGARVWERLLAVVDCVDVDVNELSNGLGSVGVIGVMGLVGWLEE